MKSKLLIVSIIISHLCYSQKAMLGIEDNHGIDSTPKLLMGVGNSIMKGNLNVNGDVVYYNPWKLMYDYVSSLAFYTNWQGWNRAAGGTNWTYQYNTISTRLIPYYSTDNYSTILVAQYENTNTLAETGNGYTTFWQLVQYKDSVLNSDPRVKLLLFTCNSCTPSYLSDTARQSLNNLMLTLTETTRLKIIDNTTEPLLNNSTAYLNTTYFGADGIHLTQAGYNLLVVKAFPKLLECLQGQ